MAEWPVGRTLIRREVLGFDPVSARDDAAPWVGSAWLELPVRVVQDTPEALVVYVEPAAAFTFPEGEWPTTDGFHPWHGNTGWHGHGCLMVQRPGEHHAVWHFWEGEQREFACWYINLQTAFRRTMDGFDTQDLELDLVVSPDRSWVMKDWEMLDQRVAEGRYTPELAAWIRALGTRLGRRLDAGDWWWDERWSAWTPSDLPDDTSCMGCGAGAAPRWDTADGRVHLCQHCAAMNGIGCP